MTLVEGVGTETCRRPIPGIDLVPNAGRDLLHLHARQVQERVCGQLALQRHFRVGERRGRHRGPLEMRVNREELDFLQEGPDAGGPFLASGLRTALRRLAGLLLLSQVLSRGVLRGASAGARHGPGRGHV